MNIKKILAIVSLSIILLSIVSANTGFSTFWEYAQSIGTSYLTNTTVRNTIITEPITSNESIRSDALNSKFGALNKDIEDLKTQIAGLAPTSAPSIIDCGGTTCLGYVSGIADGESTEREFLVFVSSNTIRITSRRIDSNVSNSTTSTFDDNNNTYASTLTGIATATQPLKNARILKGDYEHIGCLKGNGGCIGYLKGIGDGETLERNFLVVISSAGVANIVHRYNQNNVNFMGVSDFDDQNGSYSNIASSTPVAPASVINSRVIKGEYTHYGCGDTWCLGNIAGKGDNDTINKNYVVRVLNDGRAMITSRMIPNTATPTSSTGNYFDDNLSTYKNGGTISALTGADIEATKQTRIVASEYEHVYCSSSNCFGYLTGIADGENVVRNFFVSISASSHTQAYIMVRSSTAGPTHSEIMHFDDNLGTYTNSSETAVAPASLINARLVKGDYKKINE